MGSGIDHEKGGGWLSPRPFPYMRTFVVNPFGVVEVQEEEPQEEEEDK